MAIAGPSSSTCIARPGWAAGPLRHPLHELTDLEQYLPRVPNYNVAVAEKRRGRLPPPHRTRWRRPLLRIHVARLAVFPAGAGACRGGVDYLESAGPCSPSITPSARQLGLFSSASDSLVRELAQLPVEAMSPIEALNQLDALRNGTAPPFEGASRLSAERDTPGWGRGQASMPRAGCPPRGPAGSQERGRLANAHHLRLAGNRLVPRRQHCLPSASSSTSPAPGHPGHQDRPSAAARTSSREGTALDSRLRTTGRTGPRWPAGRCVPLR